MLDLLLIIVFCVLGVLLGVITGLLPGLHVNNVALIMLSTSSAIVTFFSPLYAYGISEQFILILIAGFMISLSISHSFHDTIPTTFIGAPEEETALSVLPAHSLLLKGEGYKAVALAVLGSYGSILVCLALLYPLWFVIGPPLSLYTIMREGMIWVLLAIVVLMISTEKTRITDLGNSGKLPSLLGMLFAAFVFVLSGIFGILIFDFHLTSPIGLPAPVLFPALAGLFGVPTLLNSLFSKPVIPEQKVEPFIQNRIEKKSSLISILTGSFAGMFVSLIPGLTTATGTVLAMSARQKSSQEQTIVTLSAVNTAATFSVTVMLFIILRARSGVTLAVRDLMAIEPWDSFAMPVGLVYLLMFLILSGVLSYFLTLYLGRLFAKKFHVIPYQKLVVFTLIFICALVVLFTGILGLIVLFVATSIGFLPISWGVRRSHCMGILLIPIILYFL
ncbi:MAG TPA: tripartite tricarboxylate transporter permease [Candidatus Thermoplasmatota archaeon]|nr:tripartite tricarboxylate transporter permease [Candidatus Thermoplasmatota archaeon]